MMGHLSACSQRREAIVMADQTSGKKQDLYHLRVQEACLSDF